MIDGQVNGWVYREREWVDMKFFLEGEHLHLALGNEVQDTEIFKST